MKGLSAGLLMAMLITPVGHAKAPDYDREWRDMAMVVKNRNCMGNACLGMTLREVESLPGSVKRWSSSRWERNCTGVFSDSPIVSYTDAEGTEFNVSFFDFPGEEQIEDRFRVRGISTYVQATRLELTQMAERLADRWTMYESDEEWPQNTRHWHQVIGDFYTTELTAMLNNLPRKSLLNLNLKLPRYPDWMRSQPACRGVNAPLPRL